ncbi:MAG: hypothetical protein AB8G05_17750 [Oligoflexales bacterium]
MHEIVRNQIKELTITISHFLIHHEGEEKTGRWSVVFILGMLGGLISIKVSEVYSLPIQTETPLINAILGGLTAFLFLTILSPSDPKMYLRLYALSLLHGIAWQAGLAKILNPQGMIKDKESLKKVVAIAEEADKSDHLGTAKKISEALDIKSTIKDNTIRKAAHRSVLGLLHQLTPGEIDFDSEVPTKESKKILQKKLKQNAEALEISGSAALKKNDVEVMKNVFGSLFKGMKFERLPYAESYYNLIKNEVKVPTEEEEIDLIEKIVSSNHQTTELIFDFDPEILRNRIKEYISRNKSNNDKSEFVKKAEGLLKKI